MGTFCLVSPDRFSASLLYCIMKTATANKAIKRNESDFCEKDGSVMSPQNISGRGPQSGSIGQAKLLPWPATATARPGQPRRISVVCQKALSCSLPPRWLFPEDTPLSVSGSVAPLGWPGNSLSHDGTGQQYSSTDHHTQAEQPPTKIRFLPR